MTKLQRLIALGATATAATLSTAALACDPVPGMLIGGGIGAAIGNAPGAAVGAILGSAITGSAPCYAYGRPYVERAPVYYDRGYAQAPAPVYREPAPVYRESAPAYSEPAPVYREQVYYDAPPPVYYRPAPVYYAPPVYYAAAPIVIGLGGYRYYHGRRWR